MEKKKKRLTHFPTKMKKNMVDGPDGMSYLDHLKKKARRNGTPLTQKQLDAAIRLKLNPSKYDR